MSLDALFEPFQYSFMLRAFIGTSLVAIISAAAGTFVVLRGLAFFGDAIAHTSFTGIACAILLGINTYLGALIAAVFTALGVVFLTRHSKMRDDTALAILFTGIFAFGLILLTVLPGYVGDLNSLLLGSVMAIQVGEIWLMAVSAIIVGLILFYFFNHFVFVSFDPVGAEAAGFPVVFFQTLLLVLIAVTIVVSIRAVGVILVVALLITPAATASLITNRIQTMLGISVFFGFLAAFAGLYGAYFLSSPPGATIVLVATAIFILVLASRKFLEYFRSSKRY